MAGRMFLSKTASLIGRHASASAARTTPEVGVRVLNSISNGAIRPSIVIPDSNVLHRIASRYFNTIPCYHGSDKLTSTSTAMTSLGIDHMKTPFVGYVKGAKRTFSSTAAKRKLFIRSQRKPLAGIVDKTFKARDTLFVIIPLTCIAYMLGLRIARKRELIRSLGILSDEK